MTLEDAIEAGIADGTNPRRGPYVLLISTANRFMMEKALQVVPQQGFSIQSSAQSMIRAVIAYDGWTGTRGALTTTTSPDCTSVLRRATTAPVGLLPGTRSTLMAPAR